MAIRLVVVLALFGAASASMDLKEFETLMKKSKLMDASRRLDAHEAMQKCMEACPDMAKMGEAGGDMEKMCPTLKCLVESADCESMVKQMGDIGSQVDCICTDDMLAMMKVSMEAEKGEGVCKDAVKKKDGRRLDAHEEEGEDGGIDPCAVAGDCKAIMEKAAKMLTNDAKCASLKEAMNKDSDDAEKKCIEDLAAPAASGGDGEAAADAAGKKAVLGMLTGMLLLAARF